MSDFSYMNVQQHEAEIEQRVLQLAVEAKRLDDIAKQAEQSAADLRQVAQAAWQVVRVELREAADRGFHLPLYFDNWR